MHDNFCIIAHCSELNILAILAIIPYLTFDSNIWEYLRAIEDHMLQTRMFVLRWHGLNSNISYSYFRCTILVYSTSFFFHLLFDIQWIAPTQWWDVSFFTMIISVAIVTIFIRFRKNDCFFPVIISIAIVNIVEDS